jgi:hypothetical protein
LTEAQVAESAGVVKIWGCENFVLELNVYISELKPFDTTNSKDIYSKVLVG